MAKTLIGNIKGKNGRGIASIKKTGTTGPVDTYTITYTDNTTSTFTVNNSDNISLQRQIVPSAAVESSTTASQAYAAGSYVVVNGVLRKVKSSIAKGNVISDSNSTATTVSGEIKAKDPVILYNNASGGRSSIPLSESAANFAYIEIFGGKLDGNGGGYTSVKVYDPNGKRASLTQVNYIVTSTGDIFQTVMAKMLISGTSIKVEADGCYNVDSKGIAEFIPNENKLLIYRVVGYRK